MTLLITYLLLALTISFSCSLMEAVLLSTPMTYLKARPDKEAQKTKRLINYKANVDRPLSAILSLNTVAHTVGAAGVGAQASIVFGEAYFGLVSAILTILILVITEIFPKTIGANYWRYLGGTVSLMLRVTIFITYPLVIASGFLTKIISPKKKEKTTSREEISELAEIGTKEGVFRENENKIIQNLIKLQNIKITEILTPRTVVLSANEDLTLEEFISNKDYLKFSRIPLYSFDSDNITGYIFGQDIFGKIAENKKDLKLKKLKKDIVIIPTVKYVLSVWEELLEKKEHIALIIDEYGSMKGIVTMEDIIETLVGFEIVDENDTITDMQQYARERWLQRQTKYKYF